MIEVLQSVDMLLSMSAMLVLVFISGFFSSSETAIFYLSHDELRRFRLGNPRERLVRKLLLDPDRLLTAVLFWNLLVNLSYFSISVVVVHRLTDEGHNAAAGLFGLFSLFGIILFGEALPKSAAVVYRCQLAPLVIWPMTVATRLLDPVTPYFRNITRLIRRIFWPNIAREPFLDADDLEQAVENVEASDEVIRQERQVLHNILDLSEITVEEVMRPRGTYLTLSPPIHLEELKADQFGCDYVAILQDGTEEIESAISLTDVASIPKQNLEQLSEDVVHVPWCANLAYALQLSRDQYCSVVSVVNEFGETIGIVTYEDMIDTIVVPQPSRAKRVLRKEPVVEIEPGCYQVEAITTLRYLSKRLGVAFEYVSDGPFTVAGMLQGRLERIPVVGDECTWQGYRVQVTQVSMLGRTSVMFWKIGGQ